MKSLDIQTLISFGLGLILAWFFLHSGYPKLHPSAEMVDRFTDWGFSRDFALTIGILEIIGAILVLIPRTAFYGAVWLIVIMIGAIYTHVSTGIGSPTFAVILLLLAILQAYLTRHKARLVRA